MWNWLGTLIPGVSAIRLAVYAVLAMIALGLAAFTFFTVKGWHDDAAQVPSLRQHLDQAQAAYAALDTRIAGRLDGIAGTIDGFSARLDAIDLARTAADSRITAAQAATARDVQDFLKRYQNAPADPACVEPQSVRDGLLGLFPDKPRPQPSAASGGHKGDNGRGGGAGQAGSSHAARAPDAVPGRQHAAGDRRPVGMPATARRGGRLAVRHAAGTARQADRGAAKRSGPAFRVAALAAARRAAGTIGARRDA